MYVVFLCGPTDCFAHAAFVREEDAKVWLAQHLSTPEGGHIKHLCIEEALNYLEEED